MHSVSSRHLGSTASAGPISSGSRYVRYTERQPHTSCWMELAVYDSFPAVPSLAGSQTQACVTGKASLSASTRAAGRPACAAPIRLCFELFDDESPVACANFRRLCAAGRDTGASSARFASSHKEGGGTGIRGATMGPWQSRSERYFYKDLVPSYKGTTLHKIIPGFCVQGGDLTMRLLPNTTAAPTYRSANQFSGVPARRVAFPDENMKRRHNAAGLLSLANTGPNSNGTQFFITTSAAHEQALNGRHVCFGQVTSGLEQLLQHVAPFGDVQGKPSRYVVVVDCGDGPLPAEESTEAEEDTFAVTAQDSAPPALVETEEQQPPPSPQSAPVPVAATLHESAPPMIDDVQPPQQQQREESRRIDILVVERNGEAKKEVEKATVKSAHRSTGASARVDDSAEAAAAAAATAAAEAHRERPFAATPAAEMACAVSDAPATAGEAAQELPAAMPPPPQKLKSSLKSGPAHTKKRVTIQI